MAKLAFKGRTMPTKRINISKIDLDLTNPRLLIDASDQHDAMVKMLKTTGDKCMELLRDITNLGELSSADLPIVVETGNRYTVLEGNRRVLCLRLWRRPKIISSLGEDATKFVNRVNNYTSKSEYSPPDRIDVVVAASREQAQEWIDKKHGLGGGGSGTVEWDTYQKDRRRAQTNPTKTSRGYAFVSFMLSAYPDDEKLGEDVWTLVDQQYSVLERVLGDRAISQALGLTFKQGVVTLQFGRRETMAALQKLISDLGSKAHNSRTLHSSEQRKEYAKELGTFIPTTKGEPYVGSPPRPNLSPEAKEPTSDETAKQSAESPKPRRKKAATKPRIFGPINLDQFPDRLRDLAEEVSKLDVTTSPEIGAAIVRVVLDLCMEYFEKEYNFAHGRTMIGIRARNVLDFIYPEDANTKGQVQNWTEIQELRNRWDDESMKSIQLGVHSYRTTNIASEVTAWGGRIEPVLVAMNDYLRNNPKS